MIEDHFLYSYDLYVSSRSNIVRGNRCLSLLGLKELKNSLLSERLHQNTKMSYVKSFMATVNVKKIEKKKRVWNLQSAVRASNVN